MGKLRLLEDVCFIAGIVSYFFPWFFYGFGNREPGGLSLHMATFCWISAYALAMGERHRQAKARVRELTVTPIHMDDYSDYHPLSSHEPGVGIGHVGPRFECPECAKPGFSSG